MDTKYYKPEISDFYIGYECEAKRINEDGTEDWIKLIYNYPSTECFGVENFQDLINFKNSYRKAFIGDNIRTPYLTLNQLYHEGWEQSTDYERNKELQVFWGTYGVFKDNYMLRYQFEKHELGIQVKDPSLAEKTNSPIILFNGICKSINEFRKIIKYLNI